jgi:hypothetical protein
VECPKWHEKLTTGRGRNEVWFHSGGGGFVPAGSALAAMLQSGEIAKLAPSAGLTYLPPRAPDILKHILTSDLRNVP